MRTRHPGGNGNFSQVRISPYGPWEVSFFFPWAHFVVFYNPWDEEISIPETHGPFGNFIPVRVNQVIKGIEISQWPSHI